MGLQTVWGPLVAWYLFLAGMGAGAYLVGVAAGWLGEPYKPLVKPGIFLGMPSVAVGCLLLLLELGSPLRFWMGFARPFGSMMSVGIVIISVFLVLGALHMAALLFPWLKVSKGVLRWLGLVGGLFALGTAGYTGLLLAVMRAVPFWNTPVLPVLFLASALSTGIGAVLIVVGLERRVRPRSMEVEGGKVMESLHALSRIDVLLVAVELLVLFFLLFTMIAAHPVAAGSARYIVAGDYAAAFWLGVVVLGLLVPAALEIWSLAKGMKLSVARLTDISLLAGFCLLVGGVILRYAIVAAGANVSRTL